MVSRFIFALFLTQQVFAQEGITKEMKDGKSFIVWREFGAPGRMWLWLIDDQVKGFYSNEKSEHELLGSWSNNILTLDEIDSHGKLSGHFEVKIDPKTANGAGEWQKEGKKMPITLSASDWIWLAQGTWISPAKSIQKPHDRCQISSRWPQLVKTTGKISAKLNLLFTKASGSPEKFCRRFLKLYPSYPSFMGEKNEDFRVLGMRGDLLSLSFSSYEYEGGAHGIQKEACRIFDTASGKEITSLLIDPKMKTKLRKLVEQSLIDQLKEPQGKPKSIKEVGIDVSGFNKAMNKPKLCLEGLGHGGYIQFDQGEIGPMAWGTPKAVLDEKELTEIISKKNSWLKTSLKK